MNFLHYGALTFDTLVYDTNVGDIRFSSYNVLKTFIKHNDFLTWTNNYIVSKAHCTGTQQITESPSPENINF